MLSAPLTDQFPGQDSFKGKVYYTSMYPKDAVDLLGKRVGVSNRRPPKASDEWTCLAGPIRSRCWQFLKCTERMA
jgi:hypothetical protein